MDNFWNAQLGITQAVQSWGSAWLGPMNMFTLIGREEFYLAILPVIYWAISASIGLRLGLLLLVSTGINEFLKLAFHHPRPYWFSTEVRAYGSEPTFGIASGHAQNAVAMWGLFAYDIGRRWAWLVAIALMVLISLSRIYLGVHFATDVLAGWLVGVVLLFLVIWLDAPVSAWLKRLSFGQQAWLSLALSLGYLALTGLVMTAYREWIIPPLWLSNAIAVSGVTPDPVAWRPTVTTAGAFFGLGLGMAWLAARGGFHTSGTIGQKLARILIGMAGLLLVWLVLRAIFPRDDSLLALSLRYARYTLVGAWVAGGAPYLFVRLGLARPGHV